MNPGFHPAISHLSATEVSELVFEYNAGTSLDFLIQHFRINIVKNQIIKILPPITLDRNCVWCSASMVRELPPRTRSISYRSRVRCSTCNHIESESCVCNRCIAERRKKAVDAKILALVKIENMTSAERVKCTSKIFTLNEISLYQAMALLALLKCVSVDDEGITTSLAGSPIPYTPTSSMEKEMLDFLRASRLVAISDKSPSGVLWTDGDSVRFDQQKVFWFININPTRKLIKEIEVAGSTGNWPDHWMSTVEIIWRDLGLFECRQFYDYCAAERNLRVQSDSAVNSMLKGMLRDFSIGQVCRFIWYGAKDAADFLVRKKVDRVHASNYMIGACLRSSERSRTSTHEQVPFTRNCYLPRSMVSHVLFDVIFKIGEAGFSEPANIKIVMDRRNHGA